MEREQFNVNLGNALREIRQEMAISQEIMAEKAGLSRNYIGEIERGEKSVSVFALVKILEANGISASKFMERV